MMDDVYQFHRLWVKAPLYQKLQENEYSGAVCIDEEGDQGWRKDK